MLWSWWSNIARKPINRVSTVAGGCAQKKKIQCYPTIYLPLFVGTKPNVVLKYGKITPISLGKHVFMNILFVIQNHIYKLQIIWRIIPKIGKKMKIIHWNNCKNIAYRDVGYNTINMVNIKQITIKKW